MDNMSIDAAGATEWATTWDPRYGSEFARAGFEGFIRLAEAVANPGTILGDASYDVDSPGVYAVFAPLDWNPLFETGPRENVINPWAEERLRERWIPDVELIYIGCAGRTESSRTLRARLGDLLRHGAGRVSMSGPHKGGERMWQCVGWQEFTLAWRACGPCPEPHDREVAIGLEFVELAGALPFANVRL